MTAVSGLRLENRPAGNNAHFSLAQEIRRQLIIAVVHFHLFVGRARELNEVLNV
jgi:hypothetical protein